MRVRGARRTVRQHGTARVASVASLVHCGAYLMPTTVLACARKRRRTSSTQHRVLSRSSKKHNTTQQRQHYTAVLYASTQCCSAPWACRRVALPGCPFAKAAGATTTTVGGTAPCRPSLARLTRHAHDSVRCSAGSEQPIPARCCKSEPASRYAPTCCFVLFLPRASRLPHTLVRRPE